MELLALGLNHRTADIEMRESAAFTPGRLPHALEHVHRKAGLQELAILSTCNRTELYCALGERDANAVIGQLCAFQHLSPALLEPSLYFHWNEQAVRHMMRVASGLDSMVLGEPQIFGQIKAAFSLARDAGTLGPELQLAADRSYAVAKQVRTDTAIGENPTSIAYLAVRVAQRIFARLGECSALLIGAGENTALVGRHLASAGTGQITVANRTLRRAEKLAAELGGEAAPLGDLQKHLARADIVISSTSSLLPILGKGAVERALRERRQAPVLLVDLAMPRDIEPEVATLKNAYLYSIDDLQQLAAGNRSQRVAAAREAERMIDQGVARFSRERRALTATDTLVSVRRQFEQMKREELEKTLAALKGGAEPEELLTRLANQLTSKLLHGPTARLKKAGAEGDSALISQARRLFDLKPGDSGN